MQKRPELISLFTDFGIGSHYLGQLKARLLSERVKQPVIDLCSDAPVFNPRASAYLLASFLPYIPPATLFLCVVDPGVGSDRRALLVKNSFFWFLGPDNGLLSRAVTHLTDAEIQTVELPELSDRSRTFDGRDYFAPAAALLCNGAAVPGKPVQPDNVIGADWPDQLPEVIYLDSYGNAVTGLSGRGLADDTGLRIAGRTLQHADTFSRVSPGTPFWYVNANGLVEIAVSCGNAAQQLGLSIGMRVEWCA